MSAATNVRGMTAEDLLRLRFPYSLSIAPDGSTVAYTTMAPNGQTNRNEYALWLVPSGGGPVRSVLDGQSQDPAPAWSPDGATLAFIANLGQGPQIHTLDVAAGDAAQPTAITSDASVSPTTPIWSPDGSQLLYLARVPSLPAPWYPVQFPEGAARPRVITRRRYKLDGMGWFDERRNQIFVVPASGGASRQVTHNVPGVCHPVWTAERGVTVGKPAWSPDGTRIAFSMSTEEDEEGDGPTDVWVLDVATGDLTRATPHDGLYGSPTWSPDGTRLAVVGTPFPRTVGYVNRLWIVPAEGGAATPVYEADIAMGSGVLGDSGTPVQPQPAWVQDRIYFLAAAEGRSQVWAVDASGGEPAPVTRGDHAVAGWSVATNGSAVAFDASTPTSPGEIFVQDLRQLDAPARQLTQLNAEALAGVALSDVEEFWVTPEDGGQRVQSWIMKPPGFSPDQKYPLVLQMHGGPTALYGWSWWHEFQLLASRGFVIVIPNPRGSAGYGQEFATAIFRDWAEGPTIDLLAAVDYTIEQGYIDTDRLYLTGGSYGGYLVNWIVTQTDRFRAGVTGRCVSDLRTLVLADDIGSILEEHFGGFPWDDPELYAHQSPITHIHRCRTPLLIEHQLADHRCPIDQAEQVYNALRILGVPVEMVLYPNESHGMSRNGAPLNRIDRLQRMVEWFERFA